MSAREFFTEPIIAWIVRVIESADGRDRRFSFDWTPVLSEREERFDFLEDIAPEERLVTVAVVSESRMFAVWVEEEPGSQCFGSEPVAYTYKGDRERDWDAIGAREHAERAELRKIRQARSPKK